MIFIEMGFKNYLCWIRFFSIAEDSIKAIAFALYLVLQRHKGDLPKENAILGDLTHFEIYRQCRLGKGMCNKD